jgi:hypothetical protein
MQGAMQKLAAKSLQLKELLGFGAWNLFLPSTGVASFC